MIDLQCVETNDTGHPSDMISHCSSARMLGKVRCSSKLFFSKHLLLAATVCTAVVSDVHAQFEWAKRVAGTQLEDDELAIGMAQDQVGNVYVTGWFDGSNDFGGVTLNGSGFQDIFVAKYDSIGGLVWARREGGDLPEWDAGRGVGVDDAGNFYVAGGFYGVAQFGSHRLSSSNPGTDFFLTKYDNAGNVIWARQATSADDVYATGLAVDSAGNSYAVGYADHPQTVNFGSVNLTAASTTGYSTFLVKYNTDGDAQWGHLMGGPGQTYGTKVAVDTPGNVYVRAQFGESISVASRTFTAPEGKEHMFLAKFSSAGALTWVAQAEAENFGEGGVAIDQAGNVYTSGAFGGTGVFGTTTLTNAGGRGDAFIAKYDSGGALQWVRRAGGSGIDVYLDLAVDAEGDVYATGALSADAVKPNGSGGAIIVKYDAGGTNQWAYSATGEAADPIASIGLKVCVDPFGGIYLAGWYRTATTFGDALLQPQSYWNYFLTKMPGKVLAARRTANGLSLSWPSTATGYGVESTLSLSAPISWTNEKGTLQTNQGSISMELPLDGQQTFFRLAKARD